MVLLCGTGFPNPGIQDWVFCNPGIPLGLHNINKNMAFTAIKQAMCVQYHKPISTDLLCNDVLLGLQRKTVSKVHVCRPHMYLLCVL